MWHLFGTMKASSSKEDSQKVPVVPSMVNGSGGEGVSRWAHAKALFHPEVPDAHRHGIEYLFRAEDGS